MGIDIISAEEISIYNTSLDVQVTFDCKRRQAQIYQKGTANSQALRLDWWAPWAKYTWNDCSKIAIQSKHQGTMQPKQANI